MKFVSFALAVCALASFAFMASARESAGGSDAAPVIAAPLVAAPNQNDITASLPCKKVIVEIDEGYGVSSRETRYDCAPRD